MKRGKLKHRLISALLVLVMMITSLLGTTFAWFTDEVTSAGNTIQSGSLKIDLLHKVDADWVSLKANPEHKVFDYDKWEPGYTRVETLKVANLGNLALQYRLSVEVADGTAKTGANGENLADVIDVYVIYGESTENSYEEITTEGIWVRKGTLTEVMNNPVSFMGGELLPTGEVLDENAAVTTAVGSQIVKIALHMQDSAGNAYQDLSVGDIYVNLLATQWSYENDTFGNGYDSGASFPSFSGDYQASASVDVDADGKVQSEVTLKSENEEVSASVPVGTLLEDGVNTVTLTVSSLKKSESNIKVSENQVMNSVDVHVSGIADGNTAPILVTVKELLAPGLNMGNYQLYHVENGNTVAMTYVASAAELDAHNEYVYNPATGDVTMALCSFSEITLVLDAENAWEGEFDYSWYKADAIELTIANADQLAAFGAIVGGMNEQTRDSFAGKTVKLLADINLGDKESENNPDLIFYPIGYYNSTGNYSKVSGGSVTSSVYSFEGTFDGNGNTIANFYQNTWEMFGDYNDGYSGTPNHYKDGMGLFGYVYGGTVKNLTVDNFSSDGEFTPTGVVAAYAAENVTFENIAITNCNPRVYNTGNGGIVGIGGDTESDNTPNNKITLKNITVDQSNTISALWGSYDVACGGLMGMFRGYSKLKMENCHVAAVMDVNNDVCGNYQYYWYRYSGMFIGSVRRNSTNANYTVAYTDGITAEGCTYTYGAWNEYWYCELVANSIASYTHDHQFSRLTKITDVSEIQDKNGNWNKEGNFVIPTADKSSATCYHIFKDFDGNLYEHEHDAADESNPEIYETFDLNGDGELNDLKEDRTCYYIPFGQMMNGNGYGVKPTYEFAGFTEVKDGTVLSGEKFMEKSDRPTTYRPGQTIKIGDLFKSIVNDSKLSKASIFVSVSPATENDNVSATYAIDLSNWENGTITFDENCNGAAKIVITDYFYCTKTVIVLNSEQATEKFIANNVSKQDAYSQITLGNLFTGANIDDDVTATILVNNEELATVNGTSTDWDKQKISLTKDGEYRVIIKENDDYCKATTTTFTVKKVNKFVNKFTGDFLYRVGNNNPVTLGSLFGEIETGVNLSYVNVTIEKSKGDAQGTFTSNATWTDGTIQFSGTGVVKVTISADGANPVELNLEVVDATNLTEAKGTTSGGTFVLLCGVNTESYVYYYNAALYGNGFTYSLKGAPTTYNSSHGHGVLITKNATLDNLVIVGDVYDEYGAYTNNNDYNAAIDVLGDTVIQNCYISGCSAPISTRANATITNTTLYGGAVANLLIKGGTITLENVTTANYNDGRNAPIGMGIVIHSDAAESAKLILNGTLTQYNFLNEEDTPTDTYAKNLHSTMFGTSLSKYHFGTSPNRRVNTGVVSLTATFNEDDITDNANTGYIGTSVTLSGISGYVYTQPKTVGSVNNGYDMETDSHVATTQGAIPPSYSFDHTVNYVAKTDGSNDYCYEENGTVYISMDTGDSFDYNTSILTLGKNLTDYTVSMNGADYTEKSITFNTAGKYEIVYTYTDSNNYALDENGNITTYSATYTKSVKIVVSVIEASAKNAEFTMGSSNAATEKITIDNTTYISATGVTADNSTWTYITIDGQKIYYPIVAAKLTATKGSSTYAYFPVFENVITITDYANNGTGDEFVYNSSTTTASHTALPTAVKGIYKAASDVPYWYNLTNSNLTQSGASKIFKWASSSDTSSDPEPYNNVLCYKSPQISADRVAYVTLVQYSYTDATNTTYYYYVGYTLEAFTKQTTCVTPDTLVTLADGTQKRIDEVTYSDELLVWNFYTGEYDAVPSSIIMNHGYDNYTVVTLKFSDGTEINTINGHGFFSTEENKYVILSDNNAADYIGSEFLKADGDNYSTVTLVDYSVKTEYTESWSVLTAGHYNCILEGLWTVTPAEVEGSPDYLMPFEVGEDMKYDEAKMQADIETYGLYTYYDFADYMAEEQFTALSLATWKVAVGKGYITWDDILYLVSIHIG